MDYNALAKKFGAIDSVPPTMKTPKVDYSALAQKFGGTNSQPLQQSTTSQPETDGVKGGFFGNLLTGSTQKFGKTIGESIAAPGNADLYSENLGQHTKIQNDLIKAISAKKKLGQDTSRLENALQQHLQATPKLEDYTGNVINKTAGQVIGEGIGTGLEALSGGALSSGIETAASKTLPLFDKIKKGAKIGAAYGAIGGGSGAMQEGGGFGDTLVGAGVGAGLGAGTGALFEVGASALGKTRLFQSEAEKEANKFTKNLKNAEESIYPTTTKNEKSTTALKDKNTIFGKKSVPDLQNTPATKPVIESVANLPDDIKVKPSDTVAVKDSKLRQGITRLHQMTEGNLAEPEVKAMTTYEPSRFQTFMREKVLDPIEKEFGKTSPQYIEAVKGIKTAEGSISEPNAFGVHTGRQSFDTAFKKENPRAFKIQKTNFGLLDPHVTTVIETGRDIRTAMNDFAESLLPENHPFRSNLREESNLIKALQEMRSRSTTQINKNAVSRAFNRNPTAKVVAKKTLNAATVGTLGSFLK